MRKGWGRIGASAAVIVCAALSHAQNLNPIERDNVYNLAFSDLTFSDAGMQEDIYQLFSGPQSNYFTESFSTPDPISFNYWSGDSNIGVSDISVTGGLVSGNITSLTGQDGWTDLNFGFLANSSTFMTTGVSNGLHVLDISAQSNAGVIAGDPYYWNLVINGDWSSQGTGTSQSELIAYNSADGWQVTNDFVYDSVDNVTLFSLYNPTYDGSSGVGLQLQLNGSTATPGPSALAAFGISAVAALKRRRR